MKVSVVIPTRNRSSLVQAIQSLYLQTRRPDEVIIIDDASETPVEKLLDNHNFQLLSLHIERFEIQQGPSRAKNQGIKAASGDVIMFLDDDDTWKPTKVSDQISVFDKKPEVGFVYSGRLMVKNSNREKVIYSIPAQEAGILYPKILYRNLIGNPSSIAVKKSVLDKAGDFDENFPAWEDYDLWIRCCKQTMVAHDNACNVRYTLAEVAQKHKQSAHQLSRGVRRQQALKMLLDKYWEDIQAEGFLGSRKIQSEKLYGVARGMREQGLQEAMPWILKSFRMYPNPRFLNLFFPIESLQYWKGFLNQAS